MRIFVVSDCQLYLAALAAVLRTQTDVELVGLASDLQEAATCLRDSAADIVLIDELPTGDHLQSLRAASRTIHGMRFVVVGRRDDAEVRAWLDAGATKIVDHRASADDLRGALQATLRT